MTDTEITAVAREYAEECCPIEAYEKAELINPDKEEIFERKADLLATQIEFEQFLEWLTRRYCLVEKSKVEEEYHEATMDCGNIDPCSDLWEVRHTEKCLLESLFPGIGKEVEG